MKEIEVKAYIRDHKAVTEKLLNLGCAFGEPIIQNDVIYGKADVEDSQQSRSPVARIRDTGDGTILFTVKRRGINELAAEEHEVNVNSAEELEHMLILLGQKEVVRINKSRTITHYKNYEICLDKVENLGNFIEVEYMLENVADDETVRRTQEKMANFLISLGVALEDHVTIGYNTMLLAKKEKGI